MSRSVPCTQLLDDVVAFVRGLKIVLSALSALLRLGVFVASVLPRKDSGSLSGRRLATVACGELVRPRSSSRGFVTETSLSGRLVSRRWPREMQRLHPSSTLVDCAFAEMHPLCWRGTIKGGDMYKTFVIASLVIASLVGTSLMIRSSEAGVAPAYVRDIKRGDSVGSEGCGGFDCVSGGVVWNVDLEAADPSYRVVVTLAFRYETTRGADAIVSVGFGMQERSALLRAAPQGDSAVLRFAFKPTTTIPARISTGVRGGPHASGEYSVSTSQALVTLEAAA